MKFEQQFTTTNEYLSLIESTLNIVLPPIYRKFILQNGGGIPELKNYHREIESGGIYNFEVSAFYGQNSNDLVFDLYHSNIILLGILPFGVFCFADDGIGNYLCVGTSENNRDEIYIVWETDDEILMNLSLIEVSIEKFVSRLK